MIMAKNPCTILIVVITSVVRVKPLHEASPGPKMPTGPGPGGRAPRPLPLCAVLRCVCDRGVCDLRCVCGCREAGTRRLSCEADVDKS